MQGYQPRPSDDVVYWNGEPVNDTSHPILGTGVRIDEIAGWEGTVELRDVRESNTCRDGERADQLFASGRTIPISGAVAGSSWEDLQSRKRALAALFVHDNTEALLKVPDPTSSVESSFKGYALALNPVAYWRLGEVIGTSARDQLGTYHGTINGNPTLGSTGSIAGDEDPCIDLDGTGDYIEVTFAAALNPANVTICAWIKRDTDTGAIEYIATSSSNADNKGWRLFIDASDKVNFQVGSGASFSGSVGTTSIAAGTWYFVTGVYDGTNTRVYVNGASEDSDAKTYSANTNTALRIGARDGSTSNLFNGKIDEVLLYNSPLTADQILQLYRRASGTVGSNDTAGYERVTARLIDSIQFGEMEGPLCQTFQVALRASDPRIYSDTTTTSATNSGKVATKADVACTVSLASGASIATAKIDTGGQFGVVSSRCQHADVVTFHTPDRLVDWQTAYYWGRLKLFDPVALWKLAEAAGVTADNAEGTAAYDGTYTNTPTLNQTGHTVGLPSVLFNGVDEYVTTAFQAALNPRVFSTELWINPVAGAGGVIGSYNANTGWLLTYSSSSYLEVKWYNGSSSGTIKSAIGLVPTGSWYHVVIVFSASGVLLYVNGVLENAQSYASNGKTFSPVVAAGAFTIGRATDNVGTTYFNGYIDNVALYDRALSGDDVAALYAARTQTPTFTNLGGYVVEPLTTRWTELAVGAFTTQHFGFSASNVTYRTARI